MEVVLLPARLLLATVFVVAGVAKLADRAGSRQALIGFGVPAGLATLLGGLLPLAELAAAVALLSTTWAWYGAVGALALLLLFVLGIGVNLALGRTPECHCFGQISSSPAGWSTLARNLALAAVAGLVVWQGPDHLGPSAVSWLGDLSTPQRAGLIGGIVGLVLLAAEGWLLLQMLRQQGRLLLRLEGLEARLASDGVAPTASGAPLAQPAAGLAVGTQAPGFRLDGLRGETLTLEALLAPGKPVLLFFTHPDCGPCQSLLPDVGRWQREHAAVTVAVVSEGTAEANRAKTAEHGVTQVLLQQKREVAEAYLAYGTPAAVVVGPDGAIGSPLALGPDAIRALVASVLGGGTPAPMPSGDTNGGHDRERNVVPLGPAAPLGQPAPSLRLPDLAGKTVDLAQFRGSKTLVLFWNPSCGFCQQMLPDLKAWEANRPPRAPRLLVVSSGTVEANQEMGLRSPVVLDPNFQAMAAFGANGTPMAVLVDPKGRITSEVAAGAQAVLTLAGFKQSATSG